jgi:hypothetical protein
VKIPACRQGMVLNLLNLRSIFFWMNDWMNDWMNGWMDEWMNG